jgi:hypothetical protein
MEDQKQNRVIVWARSEGKIREEVKDAGLTEEEWCYREYYVVIFTMNESGEKIERIVEFMG